MTLEDLQKEQLSLSGKDKSNLTDKDIEILNNQESNKSLNEQIADVKSDFSEVEDRINEKYVELFENLKNKYDSKIINKEEYDEKGPESLCFHYI